MIIKGIKRAAKGFSLQILNKLVRVRLNKSDDTYEWGEGGKLPAELIELVYGSPTGIQAMQKRASFLYGEGFADEKAAMKEVSKGVTGNQLLQDLANYRAFYYGYCLQVFNEVIGAQLTPNISSVKHMAIDRVVKKKDGGFFVYNVRVGDPEWKKTDREEFEAYHPLTENIAINSVQQGRLLYVFDRKPGAEYYPIPPYYSADASLKADGEYEKVDFEQVYNGFAPNAIIQGPALDNTTKIDLGDGRTTTEQQIVESQIQSLYGNENRGGVLLLNTKQVGGREVQWKVDLLSPLDANTALPERIDSCANRVARALGVPPVLIGLTSSGGIGDTKQIVDEITLFNFSLRKEQEQIESTMKSLFPDFDWKIKPASPLSYIPEEVLAKLTDNEIRELGGYPPLQTQITDGNDNPIAKI